MWCFALCEAAGAVLGEVAGVDFCELWGMICEAEAGLAEEVPGLEGAAGGWLGEVWREAGDGDEGLAFWLGGGDGFEEGAGVGVEGGAKELIPWGALDDAAGVHDVDDVADF